MWLVKGEANLQKNQALKLQSTYSNTRYWPNTTVPAVVDRRRRLLRSCWRIHENGLGVQVHFRGAHHDLGCRQQRGFPFVVVLQHLPHAQRFTQARDWQEDTQMYHGKRGKMIIIHIPVLTDKQSHFLQVKCWYSLLQISIMHVSFSSNVRPQRPSFLLPIRKERFLMYY